MNRDDPAPPRPPRRSIGARPNPAAEAAMLAAARDLLAERGFAGFSLDEVARRAGAGKPTLYRRWPGRADLLAELVATESRARVDPPETGTLAGDLAVFVRATLAAWRQTPAGYALRGLVAEAQGSERALVVLWDTVLPAWLRPIRTIFGEAARRGETNPADVELAVELVSGFLLRRLLTGQIDDDRAGIERLARFLSGKGG